MSYLDSLKQQYPEISKYTDDEIMGVLPEVDPALSGMSSDEVRVFATAEQEPSGVLGLAKSGYHNVQGSRAVADAAGELNDLNDPRFYEKDLQPRKVQTGSLLGMSGDELRRRSIASTGGEQQLMGEAQSSLDKGAEHLRKAEDYKVSATTQQFLTGGDNPESSILGDFLADPLTIISEIGAQSAYASGESLLQGVLLGAVAGPAGMATGSGTGSVRIEFANSLVEGLREAGVDITNAAILRQQLADNPELYQSAVDKAQKRAAAIGALDAATMGIAGKDFGLGKGALTRTTTNLVNQMGVQAVGGAAGEALAQTVADGEVGDGRAIAAEAVGELVTAPVDVAAARGEYRALKHSDQIQPTPTPENPAPAPVDRPDPANGPISAAAAKMAPVQTAEDLGVQFQEQQDWSQYEQPAAKRGTEAERGFEGLDGLIATTERMGFTDETAQLITARRLFQQADQARASGNEALAGQFAERGNRLYRSATEVNDQVKAAADQFPVPYVATGEVTGGDIGPYQGGPERTGDTYDQPRRMSDPAPAGLEQRQDNRLTDQGIIYGEEPAGVRAAREQRAADDFSARYGQEGQARIRPEEGEYVPRGTITEESRMLPNQYQRPAQLEDSRMDALPEGTGQMDMGRDRTERTFTPTPTEYEGVGRNVIERQAGLDVARLENRKTITQGEMIELARQFREAVTTKPVNRTDEQKQLLRELPKFKSAIKTGAVTVTTEPIAVAPEQVRPEVNADIAPVLEAEAPRLLMRRQGQPFPSEQNARNSIPFRQNKDQAQVVPVEGGFAIQIGGANHVVSQEEGVSDTQTVPVEASAPVAAEQSTFLIETADTSVRVFGDPLAIRQKLREGRFPFKGAEIEGGLSFGKKMEPRIREALGGSAVDEQITGLADDLPVEQDAVVGTDTQASTAKAVTAWKRDAGGRKVWRSSDGQIITDESFTTGGVKTSFFPVYASNEDRQAGNNYATGESLAEAKSKVVPREESATDNDGARFSRRDGDNTIDPEYTPGKANPFWEGLSNGALRRGSGNSRLVQKKWVEENLTSGHSRSKRGQLRIVAGGAGGGTETIFFSEGIAGFEEVVTSGQVAETPDGNKVFIYTVTPVDLLNNANRDSGAVLTITLTEGESNKYEVGIFGPVEGGAAAQALAGTEYLSDTGNTNTQGLKYLKLNIGNAATKSFLSEAVRRLAMHNGRAPDAVLYSARDTGARAGDQTVRKFDKDIIESKFSRAAEDNTARSDLIDPAATNPAIPLEDVERIAGRIVSGWKNAPEWTAVASDFDLPAELQGEIEEQNARGQIDGVFHEGRFYLVTEHIRSESDVERIIFHEALGHYGLQQLYGPALKLHLDQLWNRIGGLDGINRLQKTYNFGMGSYWRNSEHMDPAERRVMMMDELVAHIAATGTYQPDIIQRIAHLVRQGLRRIMAGTRFAERLDRMTDVELLRIVAAARNAVVEGESRVTTLTHDPRFVRMFDEAMYGDYSADEKNKGIPTRNANPRRTPPKEEGGDTSASSVDDNRSTDGDGGAVLPDGVSLESVVTADSQPGKGMSVADVERLAQAFMDAYNGNIPLDFIVKDTQEDLYGPEATIEKHGVIKGAYLPADGVFTLAARNLSEMGDAVETIRHEVLGHYGLNTFTPADKRRILDQLIEARDSKGSLGNIWAEIDQLYSDKSDDVRAEEVFAKVVELEPAKVGKLKAFVDRLLFTLNGALRRAGIITAPLKLKDVRRMARYIAEGIRAGRRQQQTFPESNDALFRRGGADQFDDLSDPQSSFLGKIGPKTTKQRIRDRIAGVMDNIGLKTRQGMVDRYASLLELDKKAQGEDVVENRTRFSSWVLSKMSHAADGALSAMLTHGRIQFSDGVVELQEGDNKGLLDVLKTLGSTAEIERFMGWIAANRSKGIMEKAQAARDRVAAAKAEKSNLEDMLKEPELPPLKVRQINKAIKDADAVIKREMDAAAVDERLFTPEEVAAGVELNKGTTKDGKPRAMLYNRVFKEFQQHRDDVLAIAEEAGIITPDNRQMWRDEFYVPFYRVMEEEGTKGPRISKGLSRQEAYKRLQGGTQEVNDLLENTLMNFQHLLSASLKNNAARQALQNAELVGIATRTSETGRNKKSSTYVLDQGEKVWYDIEDELVFESLSALTDVGSNTMSRRIMRSFKRTFTSFTTISPQFIVANTLRDAMQSIAIGNMSYNAFSNVYKGAKAYGGPNNKGRTRGDMLASGAAFSFGHIYGAGDIDALKAGIQRQIKGARTIESPKDVVHLWRAVWDQYTGYGDTMENSNRAAIYEQNLSKGKLYAAFQSRDLMDFSSQGAWPAVKFLTDVVPFLNARLVGLDRLYRGGIKPSFNVIKHMLGGPEASMTDRQAAQRFAIVVGSLTAATIALYLANADDERFKELEEWERDAYWHVWVGDHHFTIPKPFEIGAIATMAERSLEQAIDDTKDGKLFAERLGHVLTDTFAFNPIPQAVKPMFDLYANKDSFTGRDIESLSMLRLSSEHRVRASTTDLAKWVAATTRGTTGLLSDQLVLSPVQVDFLIQGYLGWVGGMGASTVDVISKTAQGVERPDKAWYEHQPIRRFYRNDALPKSFTRHGTEFYNSLREVNMVYADIQNLRKLGEFEQAAELLRENRGTLRYRQLMNRTQKQLSKINAQIKLTQANQSLSAEAKRSRLDLLAAQRNRLTKRVVDLLEQAEG